MSTLGGIGNVAGNTVGVLAKEAAIVEELAFATRSVSAAGKASRTEASLFMIEKNTAKEIERNNLIQIPAVKPEKIGTDSSLIGKKNTLRIESQNLAEQLALQEAKAGAGQPVKKIKINDPKYPSEMWQKIQHQHANPNGSKINIHFCENKQTGERTEVKFKDIDG